jgi:hypothetical protein
MWHASSHVHSNSLFSDYANWFDQLCGHLGLCLFMAYSEGV